MINIHNFDLKLLKVLKKSYKDMIFITMSISQQKIDDYQDIQSSKALYLIIGEEDGYFECNSIEKKIGINP